MKAARSIKCKVVPYRYPLEGSVDLVLHRAKEKFFVSTPSVQALGLRQGTLELKPGPHPEGDKLRSLKVVLRDTDDEVCFIIQCPAIEQSGDTWLTRPCCSTVKVFENERRVAFSKLKAMFPDLNENEETADAHFIFTPRRKS